MIVRAAATPIVFKLNKMRRVVTARQHNRVESPRGSAEYLFSEGVPSAHRALALAAGKSRRASPTALRWTFVSAATRNLGKFARKDAGPSSVLAPSCARPQCSKGRDSGENLGHFHAFR